MLDVNEIDFINLSEVNNEKLLKFYSIAYPNRYKIILKNSCVLDLFSGSGSFGLECISRGVERLIFLENYPSAVKILKARSS